MKKLLAIALMLCMLMTAALAEALPEINWSDVQSSVTEAGIEGGFVTFDEINVKIWLPSIFSAEELSQEDIDGGYIAYYSTEDGAAAVGVMLIDVNGADLDALAAQLQEDGISDIEKGILNGYEALSFSDSEEDSANVIFATEAGNAFCVSCGPMSDEGFASVAALIIASIQAAD